jgi:hypothetical protein
LGSKKILTLILSIAITTSSFSQISAGVEISPSVKTLGFGGSLRYDRPLQGKLSLTGSIAYLSFHNFAYVNFAASHSLVSFSAGVKYYFLESRKGLYAAADLSTNYISGNSAFYDFLRLRDSQIGFSPGIGYRTNRWDFTGRFNVVYDADYLSLRAAYVFGRK